jgi:HPt (histidine-containing phosphotransfer) domain-containing protein
MESRLPVSLSLHRTTCCQGDEPGRLNARHTACKKSLPERRPNMQDPELDELKKEFLSEALDKVREMKNALDDGRSSDAIERVAYIAHQLKGAGGSYGYQRISSEAAQIEKTIESANKSEPPEPAIRQHVANLQEEIDQRFRELS